MIDRISKAKAGVVVVGLLSPEEGHLLGPILQRLQWPVLSEVTSNLDPLPSHIPFFEWQDLNSLNPDLILQFGTRIVSKTLSEWLKIQSAPLLHFQSYPEEDNPTLRAKDYFPLDFNAVSALLSAQSVPASKTWASPDFAYVQSFPLSEPSLALEIIHFLQKQTERSVLFCGNSMPIRMLNYFWQPMQHVSVYANRGASGIDGTVASAIGIAKATAKKTIAVLGDLAVLHDLNSLALCQDLPITFVVINNQGGGIFSHLPVAQEKEAMNKFFHTTHTLSFESVSQMMGIGYRRLLSVDSSTDFWSSTPQLVEIPLDQTENMKVWGALKRQVTLPPH